MVPQGKKEARVCVCVHAGAQCGGTHGGGALAPAAAEALPRLAARGSGGEAAGWGGGAAAAASCSWRSRSACATRAAPALPARWRRIEIHDTRG